MTMSSVKEDWILWANRFQTEHINLLARVQDVETRTLQVPKLQDQIDKLSEWQDGSRQIHESLRERTRRLEEDVLADRQNTSTEVSVLRTKITALEEEKRDARRELEEWKSQAIALLEKENGQVRQELMEWKTQLGTHIQEARLSQPKNSPNTTTATLQDQYERPVQRRSPHTRYGYPTDGKLGHRTFSEATTADESLLFNDNAQSCNLQTLPATTIPYAQPEPPEPISQIPIEDVPTQPPTQILQTQGRSSLEDYLLLGQGTIPLLIRNYETELVKSFVEKMREKHRKATLRQILNNKGWTWEILEGEIKTMIEDGKRRKKARGGRRAAL